MDTIDDILKRSGTDKSDPHRYGPVYDRLFPPGRRAEATAILELGIANGCSLRGWHEAFPFAAIVGFDQHPSLVSYSAWPRIETRIGDQSRVKDLRSLHTGRAWDLIVDDASHRIADQLLSLFVLWPDLKPGGYYVIEEFDTIGGDGPGQWRQSVGLLKGGEIMDTTCRGGYSEPLLVVRKDA